MPKIGNKRYSKSLYLGRQFENDVRTIRFDITEWVDEFGNGTVELLHMRHGDTVPYSVPFSRIDADGNENDLIGTYVLWRVSSIDTARAFSDGQAELRYYSEDGDNYFLKSEIYRTVVSEALGTPLPEEDWYKTLVSKLDSIDDVLNEVRTIRDEILSSEIGGGTSESNYTTEEKNKLAGIEDGAEANVIVSVSVNDNPVEIVNKNVSLRIPTKVSELTNDSGYLSEHQDISRKLDANKVGVAGGVAELDENGIIIPAQLPSFVDDILEYDSMSDFPPNGESGKIYVATDTNLTYRWSGNVYVEISPSIALGETSSTAYRGDKGKAAYDHSQRTGNAHEMTKNDIGLGDVDNTSDVNKPVSTAQKAALDLKVDKITGKGLSTNDYTTGEKNKLAGIAENATADSPATISPMMDGTATIGTSANYAREDHVHPIDTSRASAEDLEALRAQNAIFQEYFANMEVYRTASGNPVTFSDAKDANLKDIIVTLTPTQDGSGDPYPPGGGKNLLELTASTTTLNGVTFTVDSAAGTVTATGTATAGYTRISSAVVLPAGSYIVSGCPAGGGDDSYRLYLYNNTARGYVGGSFDYGQSGDRAFTISEESNLACFMEVAEGYTASNLVFYPMIRRASDTDPTFAPYANVRPISGVSSVAVTRTGKNLLNVTASNLTNNGVTWTVNNAGISISGTLTVSNYGFMLNSALPLSAGTYIVSGAKANQDTPIIIYDSEENQIAYNNGTETSFTLTKNDAVKVRLFVYRTHGAYDITVYPMIRRASDTDPTFEPYQGQSVTVPLVDSNNDPLTVYGGTLDVTTGELTVTFKYYLLNTSDMNNTENYPGWNNVTGIDDVVSRPFNARIMEAKCNIAPVVSINTYYDTFFLGGTGKTQTQLKELALDAQILLPLLTPVTYQLTPAQLATLSGYNSVTTDTEMLSVTYRADTSLV